MADKKISQLTGASTPVAGTEVLPIVQGGSTVKVSIDNLTAGKTVAASIFQSTVATGTAPLTVASTTEVANLRAANATSADTSNAVKSNATTGVLQVTGPAAASTRIMTVPDANFTAARTDAANSFTGDQTLSTGNIIQGTAAKGFNFTANTPLAGMTSQLLNWYEEGTFTPTFVPSGTGFTSITYSASNGGKYIRIGNLVFVQMWVESSACTVGSASGTLRVGGLPFTSSASTGGTLNGIGSLAIAYGAGFAGSNGPQNAYVNANATTVTFYYSNGTSVAPGSALLVAAMGTSTVSLVMAGCYICA